MRNFIDGNCLKIRLVPAKCGAVTSDDLAVSTIGDDLARVAHFLELVLLDGSKAPLGRHSDLLTSRELELGAAECLNSGVLQTEEGADGPG